MRIAFYAPMKPVDHPVPSGDRRMAGLFIQALTTAGHQIQVASRFRSLDISGDITRQERIRQTGKRVAERLVRRYEKQSVTTVPQVWFTYHLYHKAPDWIGPRVSELLGIPYLVAEASFAPSKVGGRWHIGTTQSACALSQANGIVSLNPRDVECLQPHLSTAAQQLLIPPFLEPLAVDPGEPNCRDAVAAEQSLDPAVPWMICVGMMRPGDKLASYRVLADVLAVLGDLPWQLLVVGDGEASETVRDFFRSVEPNRICFAGRLSAESLHRLLAASDLFIWPAVKEAFGMAMLEAQQFGLPVVAGYSEGVATIVDDGVTGLLSRTGDANTLACATRHLLKDSAERKRMGHNASDKAFRKHSLAGAAQKLNQFITEVTNACR